MNLRINEKDGLIIVTPLNEIRDDQCSRLEEAVTVYINKGHHRFLIDLSAVTYLDSSCLRVLIVLHKRLRPLGGDIALKGLSGIVLEMFTMTRLTELFTII